MRYTLLELVQNTLSSMDSDEVNSLSDNTEAMQVALIVRDNYFNIITELDAPEHFSVFELTASGDNDKPCLMTVPTNVDRLIWVKYDNQTSDDPDVVFRNVKYKPLDLFLETMYQLNTDMDNVIHWTHEINGSTVDFFSYDNKFPEYYTTFDDETLIFDSYDSDYDTTLQKSKSLAYGLTHPTFTLEDDFTVDLDTKQYNLLMNETKAQAFAELKQVQNMNAERKARKGWINAQASKRRVRIEPELYRTPNYARKVR